MDIGALSMGMSQSALASAVSLSVMKMNMNSSEVMAESMVKMIDEMDLNPSIGSNLNKIV